MNAYHVPGGAVNILPVQFCMVWASYKSKQISWLALRVYFALWEMQARRCHLNPDDYRHYTCEELKSLLQSSSISLIRQAVQQLEASNLLTFSETEIRFANTIDVLTGESATLAENMLREIHENNRDKIIAVPRRILKLIIQSANKVVRVATLIGLLLTTMLVKKFGEFKGCCKAAWIAKLFGIDEKRVGHARAKLIAEGWFKKISTPQRILNRYGQWVSLNLEPAKLVENPVGDSEKEQPPIHPNEQKLQPPPKPSSHPPDDLRNQQTSGTLEIPSSQHPTWTNITIDDLRINARSQRLWNQAIGLKLIKPNQADQINFFSAIAHALRVGKQNPCGLFRMIVEQGLWRFISQADEFNGLKRLKTLETAYLNPISANTLQIADVGGVDQAELSKDALTVKILREEFAKKGMRGNILKLAQHNGALKDWDQERWEKAERELGSEMAMSGIN